MQPKDELAIAYTPDELGDLFAESAAAGLIDPDDQDRLARTLTLERATAAHLTAASGKPVGTATTRLRSEPAGSRI